MKKSVSKLIALTLCAALTAGLAGCGVSEAPAAAPEEALTAPAAGRLSAGDSTSSVPYKDETVYVLAGADGSVNKIIVSDWLKNSDGSALLRDTTDLTDVENVKGGETCTREGGALVWDAQGGDIYCQGSTNQDLPVEMNVTYALDGRAVSPEELAGKSGKVTIRFDYTNNACEMVEIDGKQERICVPFAMLTGLVLDSERFTNVEVSSGRVYSDGSHTVVAGLAFPGLQENLDVDAGKLEIPGYVEVTADVEDFQLANTVTIAVSDLFSQVDTDGLDSADDLSGALADLTDAMEALMDGSSRLYDGLDELLDKSGLLVDGINQLAAGTAALKTGSGDLTAGAAALETGSGGLAQGAQAIQSGLGDLGGGAEQLQAGAAQLYDGAANLQSGLEALSANSETLVGGAQQVFAALLSSAGGQLKAAGLELPELTAENYAEVLEGVMAQLPEEAAGPVAAVKASLDSYNQFYQGLVSYTAGVSEAAGGAGRLTGGAAGLAEGAEQVHSGALALREGADTLAGGATQVRDGAAALAEGAEQLERGIGQVAEGAQQLRTSAPALVDGVGQLRSGALELDHGLREFNEEGIQKLVDAVDGDLNGLVERLRATVDAARGYGAFSGGGDGQVKFVYRTEAIEAEQ